MTIRTYDELIVILADNTSGNISPEDLRDFLESTAIERAYITDGGQVQTVATADVYEDLFINTTADTVPDSVSISSDGTMAVTQLGAYNLSLFVVLDLSNMSNGTVVTIQGWQSDDDETYLPQSGEIAFTKTAQNDVASLLLAGQRYAGTQPQFFKAMIKSTDDSGQFTINTMELSITTNPIVKNAH